MTHITRWLVSVVMRVTGTISEINWDSPILNIILSLSLMRLSPKIQFRKTHGSNFPI